MYESTKRAMQKYQKEKSVQISLVFRRDNEDDMKALERIRAHKSHSAYVRKLVLENIEREEAMKGEDHEDL